MAKLPAFQFYPGDWTKDAKLRSCTHAEKGALIDLLCLMFDCDERGVLATNGRAWSDEEAARAIGGEVALIEGLTLKGVVKRVPKGDPKGMVEGALYSARMVADEHKRKLCSDAGKRGGNPIFGQTLKGDPKGTPKGESKGESKRNPTPSSSSSVSSSDIYSAYPRKVGRKKAEAIVKSLLSKNPESFGHDLLAKVGSYAAATALWPPGDERFIPHPATWFGQERFNDDPSTWIRNGALPAKAAHATFAHDDYSKV